MATTINKQKLVTQIFSTLGKGVKAQEPEPRPVLEQFIYAILREDATRPAADQAFRAMQERFYDWNEVRVSGAEEIAEVIDDALSGADARAQRMIDFLQEVFEAEFAFDLEALQKKGLKLAAKALSRYQASSDYAVSWVVQQSLGGHAIPLDGRGIRVLKRLGLLDEHVTDIEALRTSLEHQVPKAKGLLFVDLISELAESACWEDAPACTECPLQTGCATGSLVKAAAVPSAHKKPR